MYMQRLFGFFLIAGLTFGCGGETTEGGEATVTTEAGTTTTEPAMAETVLDPNLATVEELTAVAQIDDALAQRIVDGRPYLNMTDFRQILAGTLDDDASKEVLSAVFVPLNLNIASEEEFMMIPGVGEKMAHEFEEYRPYTRIAQFRREMGKYVDEAEIARYEKYVFVPVALNSATDEEILAIPGVGDRMLHEFKEYRPYTSLEQFRREIGKYVDEDELARLERYVYLDAENE